MAKRRTKAQRSAAAKASWERRKAEQLAKMAPIVSEKIEELRTVTGSTSQNALDKAFQSGMGVAPALSQATLAGNSSTLASGGNNVGPSLGYVVQEGRDIFMCFTDGSGSLNRQRVNESTARKMLQELARILL